MTITGSRLPDSTMTSMRTGWSILPSSGKTAVVPGATVVRNCSTSCGPEETCTVVARVGGSGVPSTGSPVASSPASPVALFEPRSVGDGVGINGASVGQGVSVAEGVASAAASARPPQPASISAAASITRMSSLRFRDEVREKPGMVIYGKSGLLRLFFFVIVGQVGRGRGVVRHDRAGEHQKPRVCDHAVLRPDTRRESLVAPQQ